MRNLLTSCCLLIACLGSSMAQTDPVEIPLIAGKTQPVGTVHAWNDEAVLYLQLELDEAVAESGLTLKTAKIHVGQELQDFPLNKGGNLKLGHFDHVVDLESVSLTDPIAIELGELAEAPTLLVAIMAEMGPEGSASCEAVWAEGIRFNQKKNWAMYFEYEVQTEAETQICCELNLDIITFDPMAMIPTAGMVSYTFTICNGSAMDAVGPDGETLSNLFYDDASSILTFTVTYPDHSTWSPSFILMDEGTLLTNEMQMTGFWNWGICTE